MQETQETWVQSLGREDPLEEKMAAHSRILAWRVPWTEEPGGLQSIGSQRVWHNWSNLACKIRSTSLPLIFRAPLSWTQTPIYSLFTPWSHLLFSMLEDFCFTAGNRAEYFLLGCNLCDKLATVSSDLSGYLGNDPNTSFLSSLFLHLSSREEKTWQTLLQLGDQGKYQWR